MPNDEITIDRVVFIRAFVICHSCFVHSSRVFQHFFDRRVACEDAAKPSWRSVTMPSSIAFCLSTTVGARSLINSRIGSVILSSS